MVLPPAKSTGGDEGGGTGLGDKDGMSARGEAGK